jgi:hypothetical protein
MMGDFWRHRRGGQIDHPRALGVTAEHHAGVRAVRSHRLDVGARVIGTGGRAAVEIPAGRVVDRVDAYRTRAQLRTKRVDERLSDAANTGRLGGAAGEHDLDLRARIRGCGREVDKCDRQCPCRGRYRPDDACRCVHVGMSHVGQQMSQARGLARLLDGHGPPSSTNCPRDPQPVNSEQASYPARQHC